MLFAGYLLLGELTTAGPVAMNGVRGTASRTAGRATTTFTSRVTITTLNVAGRNIHWTVQRANERTD